jgi:pyruvate/2-oxoglutarate/acetoin dehydrogenase E1 component
MAGLNSYKGILTDTMTIISNDPGVVFVGYGVMFGRVGGTLSGVYESQLIEMPLAEALMTGVAIGLSLKGYIPVLVIERFDFILLALDQIVNQLDKLSKISNGLHNPAVIIRVIQGSKNTPLFTGPTHTQDFSVALRHLVSFPVISLKWTSSIELEYRNALEAAHAGRSTLLVEERDLYNS